MAYVLLTTPQVKKMREINRAFSRLGYAECTKHWFKSITEFNEWYSICKDVIKELEDGK